MSAKPKLPPASVSSLSDEQSFRRRRAHAQIEAMTGLILQAVGYPTRRHRDFISALQSVNSGNDARVPYTPFRRAHLTLADLMMCDGEPDTRRKAVYREIRTLRRFQKRTGILLFSVTSGSDEEATEYVDYLTPAADAAVQRMLSSDLWKTDKAAAKREAVEWAVEQLPRCDIEEEEEGEERELPLTDYQQHVEQRIRGAIERAALEIERRGGDSEEWARRLMRELQRDLESRKKTAPARNDHSALHAVEDEEREAREADGGGVSGNTTGDRSVRPPSATEPPAAADKTRGADTSVRPPYGPFDEPTLFDEQRPAVAAKPQTPLDAALAYARCGWPVFPLHHVDRHRGCSCIDAKECRSPGKHPRTRKGLKDATTDAAQIRHWWQLYPLANVGLAMGRKSGLVAIDVDPRSGGDASISELIERYGELPNTLEAVTGGGGSHVFFAHPGVTFKNSSSVLGEGIDVKTDGGYVVAAPSLHASGRRYEWRTRRSPAQMPSWLLKLLTIDQAKRAAGDTQAKRAAGDTQAKQGGPTRSRPGPLITEGHRNERLFHIGCSMRGDGFSSAEIEAALMDVNSSRCSPPLPEAEVRKIAASAAKYSPGR